MRYAMKAETAGQIRQALVCLRRACQGARETDGELYRELATAHSMLMGVLPSDNRNWPSAAPKYFVGAMADKLWALDGYARAASAGANIPLNKDFVADVQAQAFMNGINPPLVLVAFVDAYGIKVRSSVEGWVLIGEGRGSPVDGVTG